MNMESDTGFRSKKNKMNRKKKINTTALAFTFLLSFLLINSCKKENLCDCIKRTGEETFITRNLEGFDKIDVEDKLDVYLQEGNESSVRIEGGENVIKLVKTKVENGVLTINNDNKCNFTRSYKRKIKVYVTTPRYKEIIHNGVGNIYCTDTLKSDSITYHVVNSGDMHLKINTNYIIGGNNGMGDIYMYGNVKKHVVYTNGEGWVNCQELNTDATHMVVKTSGRCFVKVNTELHALIERDGDVYYKGDPSNISRSGNGKGQLIKGF